MKVAFCSSEVFPFAKTGGLGDVCGALPVALKKIGVGPVLFLPYYREIRQRIQDAVPVTPDIFKTTLGGNIDVYLVDHPGYFDREGYYGNEKEDYPDNLERFRFFCRKILLTLKEFDLKVDVVHCHDWQTALIPVYLKEEFQKDPFFRDTRSILTIHNMAYQGVFDKTQYPKLELPKGLFTPDVFEFYGKINLLKAGIVYSDEVTTVSLQYAKEIQTKDFGCGLEGVLHRHTNGVTGILNGLDYDVWSPLTDTRLKNRFGEVDIAEGKARNKEELQDSTGLNVSAQTPVFGFVGRLSHQKGVDLILESLPELVKRGAENVLLGQGDGAYKEKLRALAQKYPQKISVHFEFDEDLAHRIYAGSDFFWMPSEFEPCGLSQMISMAYGTIPIVAKTGGLVDTVKPWSAAQPDGNGFVLSRNTKEEFVKACDQALALFRDPGRLAQVRNNAFQARFLWDASAEKYKTLYLKGAAKAAG